MAIQNDNIMPVAREINAFVEKTGMFTSISVGGFSFVEDHDSDTWLERLPNGRLRIVMAEYVQKSLKAIAAKM